MKKVLATLVIAGMMLGTVACGSSQTEQAAADTSAKTEEKAAETQAADAADAAEEAPAQEAAELNATLEYWSSWGETESQAAVLQAAAEEFMELNPGVKINFTFNGRDNKSLLVSAMEAGTEINMMDANWDNCISTWSDYLADLSEYYDDAYPTTDGKPYVDCVMSAYSGMIKDACDGKYMGVAYIPQAFVIFCNKDIFDACGITEYPATWEELMSVCQTIKDAGYIPFTDENSRQWAMFSYYLQRKIGADAVEEICYDSSLWQEGSKYYDAIYEAASAIAYMAEQGYYDPNVASNVNPTAQQNMVINGQIAMYINGTWLPNETAASNDAFNWGAFSFPEVADGVDGTESTAFGTYAICCNKNNTQEQMDAAFAFAVYLTTGKYDEMFRDQTQSIPMGVDAQWPAALTDVKTVMDQTTNRYLSQLNMKVNSDSAQIIGDACIKLEAGLLTVEEFIKEASNF